MGKAIQVLPMSDSAHNHPFRIKADLDEIDRLLKHIAMLFEECGGPEHESSVYVHAWCAPEHEQAVRAVQRLRQRLLPDGDAE